MIDLSGFETFSGATRARIAAPLVTLQSKGGFSLNAPAFEALGKPAAVLLMYNAATNQIALKAVPEGTPGGHRVRAAGKGHTHVVSALNFLKAYDIPYSEYKALGTTVQEGVAVLDLNTEGESGSPE